MDRSGKPSVSGACFLLDKEAGVTSRKAGKSAAGAWGFRKFGHAGTLDPDATGLLIVLLGKATRLSRFLSGYGKTYDFILHTGLVTDTDDTSGKLLERRPVTGLTEGSFREVLSEFTGEFLQRPPSFSAVRVKGRRAYRLARDGDPQELPPRTVRAADWKVGEIRDGLIPLSVTVSSGTYIRALARDIGDRLGCGGAASAIRRKSIGGITVEEASADVRHRGALVGMASVLRDMERVSRTAEERRALSHGIPFPSCVEGEVAIVDGSSGELLAVGEGDGTTVRPVCVLTGEQ